MRSESRTRLEATVVRIGTVYARRALPLLCAFLLACPSSDDDGSDDGMTRDGGTPEEVCTPPMTGGIQVDCDPTTGNGCDVDSNQSCLWLVDADDGECGCLSAPVPIGMPCTGVEGCASGGACLALSGDPAMCHQVCDVPDNTGCEDVIANDPTTAYTCAPLRTSNGGTTQRFGVCYGVGVACDFFTPNCGPGMRCGLIGRAAACRPDGTRELGETCSETEACAAGGWCVPLVDGNGTALPPTCYQPCHVDNPICLRGQCVEVGLPAGLCLGG